MPCRLRKKLTYLIGQNIPIVCMLADMTSIQLLFWGQLIY